ncbi:MAG: helix-hairpin-helix domain-containing protein, partial [Candidatus Omnitrophica bacterium]|nr:helix-hairpin-helix domain-containing protein [Candidatus Omnitrophota bacterium]
IAVWSKNEKVDSVGACVGMRGNRVRNIVNEIQGEKIDIVRYNDDIREYIKAALSPAKIAEIKLDKENQKAEVIVDDDQLSLSIGKHGQNVRLASRLIGWELDIRTKATAAAAAEAAKAKEGEVAQAEEVPQEEATETKKAKKTKKTKKAKTGIPIEELSTVKEKILEGLKAAGFNSVEDILAGKPEDLLQVKGIGEKKAEKIIEEAKKLQEEIPAKKE